MSDEKMKDEMKNKSSFHFTLLFMNIFFITTVDEVSSCCFPSYELAFFLIAILLFVDVLSLYIELLISNPFIRQLLHHPHYRHYISLNFHFLEGYSISLVNISY
jgi:hypothetical protein